MKTRHLRCTLYCAAFSCGITMMLPTIAQDGLVRVDIKGVAPTIAKNIQVEASTLPLTVQAPVEVAAKVCDVSASVLQQQGGEGGVGCTALTTSSELEKLVLNRAQKNKQQ